MNCRVKMFAQISDFKNNEPGKKYFQGRFDIITLPVLLIITLLTVQTLTYWHRNGGSKAK